MSKKQLNGQLGGLKSLNAHPPILSGTVLPATYCRPTMINRKKQISNNKLYPTIKMMVSKKILNSIFFHCNTLDLQALKFAFCAFLRLFAAVSKIQIQNQGPDRGFLGF